MENLTIGVIGVSDVGKSTLINNFMGFDDAKKSTESVKVYATDNLDEYLKMYPSKRYTFIDLPGIEEDEKIFKDESYKYVKNNLTHIDVLIVVCDINRYTDNEMNYVDLFDRINRLNSDNRLITVFAVNKCDTVEYVSETEFTFTNENEENSFDYIKKSMKEHTDNIFPTCFKQANIYIKGRKNLIDESSKLYRKYTNMNENILYSVGLSNMINFINNELHKNIDSIVEYHISLKLNETTDFSFEELNSIVQNISSTSELKNMIKQKTLQKVNSIVSHEDLLKHEKDYNLLCETYLLKFNENLDENKTFENKRLNILVEYKWLNLNNIDYYDAETIKYLYDINRLDIDKFKQYVCNLFSKNVPLLDVVNGTANSTDENISYLYSVFDQYSYSNPYFLKILDSLTIGNPTICFIKEKLLKNTKIIDYNYDFEDFSNYEHNFNIVKDLLKHFRAK